MTTPTERANAAFPGDPTRSISILTARQLAAVAIGEAVREAMAPDSIQRAEAEWLVDILRKWVRTGTPVSSEQSQYDPDGRDIGAPAYPDPGPALKRAHIKSSRLVDTVDTGEGHQPAPWCRDAWFVLTTVGDGEATTLHHGWSAICDAVVGVHFHNPDNEQRKEVMAWFLDWEEWSNAPDGFPWRREKHHEDGSVLVWRVTDSAALTAANARGRAEMRKMYSPLIAIARTALAQSDRFGHMDPTTLRQLDRILTDLLDVAASDQGDPR